MRNIRMMHQLEWIAARFNQAGIPVMVLKGAALLLTLYDRPDEREMTDIDLLVKPADLDRAQELLEELGHHRGEALFREDFFPRYYYEIQYRVGLLSTFAIDLHVRPFRLLRLSRVMPDDAIWRNAVDISIGDATVLIPCPDDMLIHLAGHSAIHGNGHKKWLADIDGWIRARRDEIDWDRFLANVESWRLVAAVRSGIAATADAYGASCPDAVLSRLSALRSNWRDRLALWHAPRDGQHLACSFLVNAVTTPGPRFVLGYLRDIVLPERNYLGDWCLRHHCPWPGAAVVLRYVWPLVKRIPGRISKIEVRVSPMRGRGVFATRDIKKGQVIARYRGRPIERNGTYISYHTDAAGENKRHEITGPLKYLNHSCRPNSELGGFRLRALVAIRTGQEITMSYGDDVCNCAHASEELAVD